ncbi:hypothetical protein QM565_08225 [Geitlerinema splendidum]|nr:hypothetical protein [Geitlerinema splendidum]
MTTLKPIVFCTLVLAALSVTQMDAFARGHEGRPHFEHPPIHQNAINNPGARPSGPATSETQVSRPKGPEVVTPGNRGEVIVPEGVTLGNGGAVVVPEGGTTVTGQKDQLKTETSCAHNPNCTK